MVKSVKVVSIVRLFQAQKIPIYRIALMQLTTKKCSLFSTLRNLRALTLVGPTRDKPVLDPLAVRHLHNLLFMIPFE